MRKITSLLMLLCVFVGTALAQVTELSQLSNDKIYAIKSGRCFLLYSEANAGNLSTSTATAITDAERVEDAINNPNQQFKIQNTGGVYYLYSVGAAKYVTKDGSLSTEPVDALEIHDVRANFPNYPWKLCIAGNGLNTQIAGQMATGITVNSWTYADAGNTFQIVDIEEKPLFDALNELSTLVNNAKLELSNKYKVTLQTSDANAPFYLSATEQGDAPISAAIDNNPETHYGSTWGSTVGHHHYWQVDLVDAANLEEFTFSYITRKNGKDTPTKINVQGSTDGEAFTDIVVLTENLPTTGGSTYASAKITNNGYRYIRFEVPSTTNNFSAAENAEQEVTIAIAEFSLSDANADNYSVNDKNKANAISAAEEVLNADNNTLKTVQDAIVAFNEAMVVGQCTVNYSFVYKGVEKLTQTVTTFVGEVYPEITVLPYGISAVKPEGVIEEGDVVEGKVTKTIVVTDNLPFVAAADYASINNWYYLKFHATALNYLYYAGTEDVLDASKTAVDVSNKDAYTWAFVGNPFDGFKVVNKLAGESKAIVASASGAIVSEGADNVLKLTASTYGTNGFFMQATTGEKQDRFNKQGGKVVYWTGADAGSTFMVEERDFTGRTELQALVDMVKAAQANYVVGTTVGYLTQASVDAVVSALASAEEALKGTMTEEISSQHQDAINAAIAALATVQPEEGKFYTIVSAMPETDTRSGKKIYISNDGGMYFENASTLAHVFQFVPASDGKYYLYGVERGTYLTTSKGHGDGQHEAKTTDKAQAKAVKIANMGRENVVSITPESGAMIHAQEAMSKVVAWDNPESTSASAWKIVEVDIAALSHSVTISEAGWATLVLGCNATIPAGVKAYVVSSTSETSATLAEITGTIPANEAVLLNAAAYTYEFKYAAEATPVAKNLLEGTVFDANINGEAYVLASPKVEEVAQPVGFYKAKLTISTNTENDGEEGAEDDTFEAFKNNAFRAYLPVPAAGVRFLSFDFGNETAIESIEGTENGANAVIYDLSGRRVQKAQKGLYIVNGVKVIK